jgi:hypothetical protein
LSQVYLPAWIGFAPVWLTQAFVGLVASGVAFLIRAILELAWPGVAPFALLFPATLIATLLAGWPAGAWLPYQVVFGLGMLSSPRKDRSPCRIQARS